MPLKITKRKGSPFLYVRGTIRGIAIFESTGTSEKSFANRYRIEREHQLLNAIDTADEKRLLDAIDAYIAKGGEADHLERIRSAIGMEFLADIDQGLIDTTAKHLFPTQSNATVVRQFYGPISWVMNYAAELRWCGVLRIKKPKIKATSPKWAEMSWFEAFWPHCSKELRAITTFLPYTGCRVTEALNLVWERVNLKEGWAYIPETKTDAPRTVYLPPVVIDRLKELMPDPATGRVFTWKDYNAVNRAIGRAVERANKGKKVTIERLSSHEVGSHTYATWMRRYGKLDARGLTDTNRWKDERSANRYMHTVVSESAKKADLLPGSGAEVVHKARKRQKA